MSYGEWKSPITLDLVTEDKSTPFSSFLSADGTLFWDVKKPTGQTAVCSKALNSSTVSEWTPEGFSVQSRVQEYGGAAYFEHAGSLYFVNKTDQILYRQKNPCAVPTPVTEDKGDGKWRYSNGHYNTTIDKIIMVREDHLLSDIDCANTVVCIDPASGDQQILVSGGDFYRDITSQGDKLAYVTWDHPNMPWDTTAIYTARLSLAEGRVVVSDTQLVETGAAVSQPLYSPSGALFYISDKAGYFNIWKQGHDAGPWYETKSESGWPYGFMQGMPGYGIVEQGLVIGTGDQLLVIDLSTPNSVLQDLSAVVKQAGYKFTMYSGVVCQGDDVYCFGDGDASRTRTLLHINISASTVTPLSDTGVSPHLLPYISFPDKISWTTGGGEIAWGYYYPPTNADYSSSSAPPLLVKVHGGPTGCAIASLDLKKQYFTSRGFSILDVDYRGSTGYGRDYRNALRLKWGVLDVEDCVHGANHLVNKGLAAGDKLTIDGGSAGGYTALACMTFANTFVAATSYYGVSDLIELAKHTHKFESRYLDSMIGKLPEDEQRYKDRSPLNHTANIKGAIGFFQGMDDRVVPPPQAESMFDAAKDLGVPTFIIEYEGEGHGFRKSENIQRSLSCELFFYGKVLGFTPADNTPNPPDIFNLPSNMTK